MFELDHSGSYSPDNFYTRSTNEHDHSSKLTVHLPPAVHQQIMGMVRDIHAYYHSVPAFVRDAVYHRLKYMEERGEAIEDGYIEWEILMLQAEMKEQAKQQREIIKGAAEVFADMMLTGDRVLMQKAIAHHEGLLVRCNPKAQHELERILKEARGKLKGMKHHQGEDEVLAEMEQQEAEVVREKPIEEVVEEDWEQEPRGNLGDSRVAEVVSLEDRRGSRARVGARRAEEPRRRVRGKPRGKKPVRGKKK